MFANILSGRRGDSHARLPNRRLVGKIDAALAALPAPWQILRNRRTSAADGPPWAKYIALHPKKGIALVDILPANPHAAVAPLDDFLQRTGFAAFSRGDPPIVAVTLAERDIAALADCLSAAFAAAPRCGIKNTSWTDAAIELLVTTPDLLLTRIERNAERKSGAQEAATEAKISVTSPLPETSAARVEPLSAQTSAGRDEGIAEPRTEPPARSEPNLSPAAKPSTLEELDWRSARLTSFEHRRTNRRRGTVALLAVPIVAAAVALIAYPHFAGPPPAPATAPYGAAPPAAEVPSVAAVAPPSATDKGPQAEAAKEVALPREATSARPAIAAIEPPAPKLEAPAPKLEAPTRSVTGTTAGAGAPASPSTAKADSQPAPLENARKVASRSPSPAQPAPQHRVKEANARPVSPPALDDGASSPETTFAVPSADARSSAKATPPRNEETVTINGLTYIRGREPHALGILTEPLEGSDNSAPTPEPQPAPEQPSGYNQVLIQPE